MSDFDREAERQQLREKYEQDRTKRRSTQRANELLLKNATVTNKHCGDCGDLLFRYEGQMFCPTCQAEGRAAANANQDAEQAAETAIEIDGNEAGAETEASANETAASVGSTEVAGEACRNPTDASGRTTTLTRIRTAGKWEATERCAPRKVASGVTATRESLVRTLTWAAEQAKSTDDPRRATEYLITACEATETISALDR